MITIDAPISFLVGSGLAYACRDGEKITNRDNLLVKGLLFQSTILTPIILYFMVRFPDWEWNYMFNARQFFFDQVGSSAGFIVLVLMVSLINLSFFFGFKAAEKIIRGGNHKNVLGMMAGVGALIGVIILAMYKQTLYLGTFAEFNADQAQLVVTNIEFLIVQGLAGLLVGGSLFIIIRGNTAVVTDS